MSRFAILFLLGAAPILAICLSLLGLETLHSNLLGWFIFIMGIVYTAGTIIKAYIRRNRFWESKVSGKTIQEEKGDRSFWLITLGIVIVFFISPLEYLYFGSVFPGKSWMEFCGIGFVALGCIVFAVARRTLGANYSGHVSIKQNQELIHRGIYNIIRHPAYLGYLLMSIGVGLGYSSLTGLASVLIVLLPAVVYRIRVEDRLLAEQFSAQFEEYSHRVKRLLPGIW